MMLAAILAVSASAQDTGQRARRRPAHDAPRAATPHVPDTKIAYIDTSAFADEKAASRATSPR